VAGDGAHLNAGARELCDKRSSDIAGNVNDFGAEQSLLS
jgi:hypothetical protein